MKFINTKFLKHKKLHNKYKLILIKIKIILENH